MSKAPNAIDVHVGSRLRLRRSILGVTQERLAEQLGLTFQQVQKYEKGVNRIGAGRLFQIAQLLNVDVQYFFADYEDPSALERAGEASSVKEPLMAFVGSSEGLQLNAAFRRIRNEEARRRIVDLVKTVADMDHQELRDPG